MKLYPGARPCSGCAYCCNKAPCSASPRWSYDYGCSALVLVDGIHRCKLVLEARGEELARIEEQLSIGAGCCSPLARHGACLRVLSRHKGR